MKTTPKPVVFEVSALELIEFAKNKLETDHYLGVKDKIRITLTPEIYRGRFVVYHFKNHTKGRPVKLTEVKK